jgi:hypothetical protein
MRYALYTMSLLLVLGAPWVLIPDLMSLALDGNDLLTLLLGGLLLVWATQQHTW